MGKVCITIRPILYNNNTTEGASVYTNILPYIYGELC